jgi:hypothetical protein
MLHTLVINYIPSRYIFLHSCREAEYAERATQTPQALPDRGRPPSTRGRGSHRGVPYQPLDRSLVLEVRLPNALKRHQEIGMDVMHGSGLLRSHTTQPQRPRHAAAASPQDWWRFPPGGDLQGKRMPALQGRGHGPAGKPATVETMAPRVRCRGRRVIPAAAAQ